jgi:exoribonuclease R
MNAVMKNPEIKQCIKDVLNYELIFLLEQAEYFIAGDSQPSEWLHYALNMPIYTHFTSPIRRYPDIIVHRQLISIIEAQKSGKPVAAAPAASTKLNQLIHRCNMNKTRAKKVSSGCEKVQNQPLRFLCAYTSKPIRCAAKPSSPI